MSTPKDLNAIQVAGYKLIHAVDGYLDGKTTKEELQDIRDEFQDILNDLAHYEMTITLTKSSEHIRHELNTLLALADRIDDHHLNKAIINAEKVIDEINEIGELNYVAKPN